ncbi:potassium channel subfamily K member 16-like isoform X1 [Cyanistes caeruleus]|uniref:potassium channel subfamily K member 16-like isoform X1 n=1 Tax=Cyanistes caeruleus TaxID=156563 RepID=UPI000CDA1747|nr:potassium channel subfamily K member 16-like isoform X1 [Cyanistes caeruleus]
MNASGSSLSLPVQDPGGNQSWEGSSWLGQASQEGEGFTLATSRRCPQRCHTEGHVQWQAADGFAGGRLLCVPAGGCCGVPGPGEDCREAGENGSCTDEGGFSAELHAAHGGRDGAVHEGISHCFPSDCGHLDASSKSLCGVSRQLTLMNLIEAIQNGVYPVGNESQFEESNWDFSNSFFFAGTVVSTIGYGTLHPKTVGGQIFCVFFALFGIPLNIVFLHRVGKMLSLLCKKLGKFLYEKGMRKKKIKFLTLLFFLATGILVFLCLPSVFFQITEGWSYSEGIYFAFITLSTIGFGDYVVGKQSDRKYFSYYRVLVAIWIIFGLAWIALLFNLLTTVLEDTEKIIVKDLQQIGKVSKDSVGSQQRRCWPVQFIPEEELLPPRAGGDAQKMESLTADSEHTKNEKKVFSNSNTIALTC